ncbi:MAG TPA: hypothetical protein IAB13_03135 [Candidatus Avanaerovorax faecigallinarum]|nr:hypothetical protein [Candidatus Avanaerovorax faecigallinarum]
MKQSTRRLRWFTVVDALVCALICCWLEELWYLKALAVFSGVIAAVCTIWDLHVSKGEWYHDYMYLYFRKEKSKVATKPADSRSMVRLIIRVIIVVMLVYLCVRFVYIYFSEITDLTDTEKLLRDIGILVYLSPLNMFWVWKIESKMRE